MEEEEEEGEEEVVWCDCKVNCFVVSEMHLMSDFLPAGYGMRDRLEGWVGLLL